MILKLDTYNVVLEKARKSNLLFWGAGKYANWQCDACPQIEKVVKGIIDNDNKKIGTFLNIREARLPIISLREAINRYGENVIIILTLSDSAGVIEQLKYVKEYKNVECYISKEWRQYNEEAEIHSVTHKFIKNGQPSIPKVINYFWIGGGKIPENSQRCIESWKKYCPDYEIKEWNENNYDFSKNIYMKQAYEKKKWGFVPDFARLDIIYNYGGIYLDTDVEIVKNIDDLLFGQAFIGWESRYYVNAGSGFGAAPHNAMIKEMMMSYDGIEFVNPDGSLNLLASPQYQTATLEKFGLQKNGRYQNINGMNVYPANFFSPKSFYSGINWVNNDTYMIHHYDASWVKGADQDEMIKLHEMYAKMKEGLLITAQEDNMEDLISVIIPVYNVERYIEECINSVLGQSYKNLEVVLIDDGSTDLSGEICDKYAKKYKNITVIHKQNGGLVSARKVGVEAAQGVYSVCIDGDDWIDREMIAYLHQRIMNSKCDIVVSNMILEFENTGEKKEKFFTLRSGIYDLKKEDNPVYKHFFVDDEGIGIMHGICGKMIKTSLYKKHQMNVPDIVSVGEDAACMYPCYMEARKVYITEGNFYHYRQRADSVMHAISKNILGNWEILFNFLEEKCKFHNVEVQNTVNENLKKFIFRRISMNINGRFGNINAREKSKVFGFPFRSVKKNSKIVLYGAGKVGQSYYVQIQKACYCYLIGIYDSAASGNLGPFAIQRPEQLVGETFDYVVIAVLQESLAKNIIKTLKDKGIPRKKIVWEKPVVYYI